MDDTEKNGGIEIAETDDNKEVVEPTKQTPQAEDDNTQGVNAEIGLNDESDTQGVNAEIGLTDDTNTQGVEDPTDDLPKKKGIKGIIEYIKTHENLRQAVLFFLFSIICGVSQMIITAVLPLILRAASDSMSEPFKWFIFDYTEKGVGEFIGFVVGSVVGQVLTFVLNRKKTFNVHDHIPFRAIAYAIMAVLIILMQTAIGGGITGALAKAVPDASDLIATIFNLIAQMVAGIAALVVNFLGNKFFIMRKFKNTATANEQTASQEEVEPAAENQKEE